MRLEFGGLQALTGDAGALQPHYGSRAAGRLTDAAHQWVNTQLPAIEAADGSALASLRDNLQQLASSAQRSLEVRSHLASGPGTASANAAQPMAPFQQLRAITLCMRVLSIWRAHTSH